MIAPTVGGSPLQLWALNERECFMGGMGPCPKFMPYDGPRGQGGVLGSIVDCQRRPIRGACVSLVDATTAAVVVPCDSKAVMYFTDSELPSREMTATSRSGIFLIQSIAIDRSLRARADAMVGGTLRVIAGREIVLRDRAIVAQSLEPHDLR